ncbi:hypothetical protein L1987_57882 [Smallanthus sonchifolius]|uniref:Uncharacterized protein n=1 Tax=Smallanthus sonchifolius TaxID=185202 RepID=A0ACB9DED9_9ASTR|nr:hypothetical protein L1987_57882 [Smallanthus sonchifolius]
MNIHFLYGAKSVVTTCRYAAATSVIDPEQKWKKGVRQLDKSCLTYAEAKQIQFRLYCGGFVIAQNETPRLPGFLVRWIYYLASPFNNGKDYCIAEETKFVTNRLTKLYLSCLTLPCACDTDKVQ